MRFYYTYGSDANFPFYGGWTTIIAENIDTAEKLFRKLHPDRQNSKALNCAGVYSEDEFKRTNMYKNNNNLGYAEHECIRQPGYLSS